MPKAYQRVIRKCVLHLLLIHSLILKSPPHEQGYMSKALYSSRLRVLLNANLRSVLRRNKAVLYPPCDLQHHTGDIIKR